MLDMNDFARDVLIPRLRVSRYEEPPLLVYLTRRRFLGNFERHINEMLGREHKPKTISFTMNWSVRRPDGSVR